MKKEKADKYTNFRRNWGKFLYY